MRAQLSQLKQNRLNAAFCRLRLGRLMPGPFPAAQPAPRPLKLGQPAMAQLRLGPAAGPAPV
jgi:hypothetical protein